MPLWGSHWHLGSLHVCVVQAQSGNAEDARKCLRRRMLSGAPRSLPEGPLGGTALTARLSAGLSLSLSPWASRGHQTNKYAHSSSCLRVCFRGNQNGTLRVHFLGRQEGLGCQGEEQGGSAAAADGKQSRRGTEGKRPCLVSRRRVLADAVFSVT